MWRTRLASSAGEQEHFRRLDDVSVDPNGTVTIELETDAVYTISTFRNATKGIPTPSPSAPFPLPYADDFEFRAQVVRRK